MRIVMTDSSAAEAVQSVINSATALAFAYGHTAQVDAKHRCDVSRGILIARMEATEQRLCEAEARLAVTHPTDAKLQTLRQMFQRAVTGGDPQVIAETLLDELRDELWASEEARAKAEKWVLRYGAIRVRGFCPGIECLGCGGLTTGWSAKLPHKPDCYIAELESRQEAPLANIQIGSTAELESKPGDNND